MKKIKATIFDTLKNNIANCGSQNTYIIGAQNMTVYFKIRNLNGTIKTLDTQGKLTFQNTPEHVKLYNKIISKLKDVIDTEPDEDELSEGQMDDDLYEQKAEDIKNLLEDDDMIELLNRLETISANNKYAGKLLRKIKNIKPTNIPKPLKEPDQGIYDMTPIFINTLPELIINDSIIIIDSPALPRAIDTNVLSDIINKSLEKHLNILLIEDDKKNYWKLDTIFKDRFKAIDKTKHKSLNQYIP